MAIITAGGLQSVWHKPWSIIGAVTEWQDLEAMSFVGDWLLSSYFSSIHFLFVGSHETCLSFVSLQNLLYTSVCFWLLRSTVSYSSLLRRYWWKHNCKFSYKGQNGQNKCSVGSLWYLAQGMINLDSPEMRNSESQMEPHNNQRRYQIRGVSESPQLR